MIGDYLAIKDEIVVREHGTFRITSSATSIDNITAHARSQTGNAFLEIFVKCLFIRTKFHKLIPRKEFILVLRELISNLFDGGLLSTVLHHDNSLDLR